MLKRENFSLPGSTGVTNSETYLLDSSFVPGLRRCSSWKYTFAPVTAGVTVPYNRMSPSPPLERTLKVTRTATSRITTGL